MREYEAARDESRLLLQSRREELYAKLPRVKEIDDELASTGIQLARAILEKTTTARAEGIEKAEGREGRDRLQMEKAALMRENGFAENYLSPAYKCARCQDTGYITVAGAMGTKKCGCLRQKLVDAYYQQSNLGEVLKRENFDQFDFRFYSNEVDEQFGLSPGKNIQAVYKKCTDFIQAFDTDPQNLLFHGKTGLGKTFLCNCVAKDLLDMGKSVLYVTAPRIFKKIEDFRFNRDAQDNPDTQLELLYEVDLLIIDDLGSEFSTVITNTELFNIINSRGLERKPVIISTNLSRNELKNAYSDRIVSRLNGLYEWLRFFGDDIRIEKKLTGK